MTASTAEDDTKLAVRSFWLLGLLNNAPWVLMLACATNISSGGVALVFLANQLPGLLAKLSAPFWFHKVSYRKRMKMASLAMGLACLLVGYGGLFNDEMPSNGVQGGDENDQSSLDNNDTTLARAQRGLMLELLGVSFTSFQCSLGGASLLRWHLLASLMVVCFHNFHRLWRHCLWIPTLQLITTTVLQ